MEGFDREMVSVTPEESDVNTWGPPGQAGVEEIREGWPLELLTTRTLEEDAGVESARNARINCSMGGILSEALLNISQFKRYM